MVAMSNNDSIDQPAGEQPTHSPEHSRRPNMKMKQISPATFFVSLALMALVAFVAGTRSDQIYAAVGPMFGIKVATGSLDTSVLQQTYQNLKANFDGKLDTAKLEDGAARGMVAAAGDQYTVFMDKKEAEDFNKSLDGQVSGIGCEIGVRNDQPTVLRVISNSPAEQAGLQVGDVFVSVNGTSVAGKDSATVALAVRGDAGTSVKLAMKRGSTTNDYTITRAQVDDPSVRWSEQNGVGVMTISRFDAQTGNLATKAAQEFKSKGVKGVVVDLRDNGGGYLDAAQAVAGLWLDHKLVVTEKTNGQVVDSIMSGSNPILAGVKTVVLVNGGSASASEILSGALQDYGVATLVGEKTFGKGTVQKVMDLPDGRILKVTVARWYTPKGKNITAQGIEPDQKVSISAADSNAGRDPQLSAAMGLFS